MGVLLVLAALETGSLAAQSRNVPADAVTLSRADKPVRIDGRLDEPAWTLAPNVALPFETSPGDNTPARVKTDCRVLFDDENLYFGCAASDPRPTSIRAFLGDRDRTDGHDRVHLMLDPFNDARRGFEFSVSPLGVQADAMFDQVADSLDLTWDAIWQSAGRITESGYAVEAAIPFKSLRSPRAATAGAWGFYFRRSYPRGVDMDLRSVRFDRGTNCALCQSQQLQGPPRPTQGLDLELVPTLTSQRTDRRPDLATADLHPGPVHSEAGLDARWSPAPGMALNATINPDFSQVEADAAQLDVNNRFGLFYPERRPFFLEAADLFNSPIRAVFTRTIVNPRWGTKVTGKSGPNAFGMVLARDAVNGVVIPSALGSTTAVLEGAATAGLARLRRDIGRSSTAGVLATVRDGLDYHNLVAGADAVLRPSRAFELQGQYLRSDSRYPDGSEPSGHGWLTQADYTTANWNVSVFGNVLSPGFRTDAGFTTQVGVRSGDVTVRRFFWGAPGSWFTKIQLSAWYAGTDDWDGRLVSDTRGLFWRYDGPRRLILAAEPTWGRERVADAVFPVQLTKTFVGLSPSGNLTVGVGYWFGDGVDIANAQKGRRVWWRPSATLRLGRRFEAYGIHTYDKLSVPEGIVYRANLSELRTTYSFTNRAFLRAIVQYRRTERDPGAHDETIERTSESALTQLLFSYKVNPQTVLFLGYADNRRGTEDEARNAWPLTQTDRTLFAKVGYAWRP